MPHRRWELLEHLVDVGGILWNDEEVVSRAAYDVRAWQKFIETVSHNSGVGEVAGTRRVEGRLTEPVDFFTNEAIDLELADGRRWRCRMRPDGSLLSGGSLS